MALSTAQDLIDSSLRLLGVIDQEGSPTTAQRSQGLDALNAIIDSLHADQLVNYQVTDEQISITSASSTWVLTTGDIATARPTKIIAARLVSGTSEYPLKVLALEDFRRNHYPSLAGPPSCIAYDPSYPAGVLYVYPVESSTLKVTSLKPWTQYSAVSDSLGIPPGYARFLRHYLAVELSPEYEMPAPEVSVTVVGEMRRQLGRINQQFPEIENSFVVGSYYDIQRGY